MGEEKLKMPKGYKIYLMVLLILVVALVIPASREKIFTTLNLFNTSEKELQLASEFNVDKGPADIDIYKENVIKLNDSKLSFLDFNGFEVSSKDIKFKNPEIYFGEETIYVIDKFAGKVQLLDKEGEKIKDLDLKLPFIKLKEDGNKIYIYRKDEDLETVDIINKEGELLKTHEEKAPILSVSMGNKDKEYLVSVLDMDEELKSVVDVYSIDGNDIGNIEFNDEVVIYSEFIVDNVLIATDKKIYILEGKEIKWEKAIKDIKDIKVVGKEIYLLYADKFEILNSKGRVKEDIVLEKDLDNIRFIENGILLFGKRDIVIPDKKDNILEYNSKEDIVDVKYYESNLLVQKDGKVEIYNIVEKGDN